MASGPGVRFRATQFLCLFPLICMLGRNYVTGLSLSMGALPARQIVLGSSGFSAARPAPGDRGQAGLVIHLVGDSL
tara:strand:- start:2785 stop:3012 length:228 start_codon:yes stop_codon:yes gene_type:complete